MASRLTMVEEQPPGKISEQDGSDPNPNAQYGVNFERLEELEPDTVASLRSLVRSFTAEDSVARFQKVRQILKARKFFDGAQYLYWDSVEKTYKLIFPLNTQSKDSDDDFGDDIKPYVTNIYQAFALAFISVLSSSVPPTKFWPQSAKQEEDRVTAKVASDVVDVIHRNNDMKQLLVDTAYYLWTDSMVGGYVRFVTDEQRFGSHDEPIMSQQHFKATDDTFACPNCGHETLASKFTFIWPVCEACGEQLSRDNFSPGETIPVPVSQGSRKVPNGQEVITVVPQLELKTPSWAKHQHQMHYVQWSIEAHDAKLKASYKNVRDKLASKSSVVSDAQERTARLQTAAGTIIAGENLTTLVRTWIRPWAFHFLKDDQMRDQLLSLFPRGAYVAFAGETYCEARNESMDDCWRILHALPGSGQNRPAYGESMIEIQERYNTIKNIEVETYEHGLPETWIDNRLMDEDAIGSQRSQPGSIRLYNGRSGVTAQSAIHTTEGSQVTPEMFRSADTLRGPEAEFLTGITAALWGGNMPNQPTASGYAMAKNSAMGRISLVWGAVKGWINQVDLLGVEVFRQNRSEDVELAIEGKGGEWDSKFIRLDQLRGSLTVYPETDESYPKMWSETRAIVKELMGSQDPKIQAIMGSPNNLERVKSILGLDDWEIPEADSRNKQWREIQDLVQGQLQVVAGMDPMTGQPTEEYKSSIPIDPQIDNNQVELEVCLSWLNSAEGMQAKSENPQGYANVRAHALEHQETIMAQQAQLAAPAVGPQPEESQGGAQ